MKLFQPVAAIVLSSFLAAPPGCFAASHREAPITALDHSADITDLFAFVSYDDPSKVTFILDVNGFLDPANGPNYFPFDPEITYSILIDNNNTATPAVAFNFNFQTEIRAPGLFQSFIGAGNGVKVPANAPSGAPAPGSTIIPGAITALDGPGSEGLSLRQHYTVTMVTGTGENAQRTDITKGTLYAVPSNVGPRTMPNYPALAKQGIYDLGNGIRVWAGTADDPFYIDVGAIFDTVNLRASAFPSGVPGVLTPGQDASGKNTAPDSLAGFNVNVIAIEVPIAMLTNKGARVPFADPAATIGVWATTSRPSVTVRATPGTMPQNPPATSLVQIQRMANPLINEVLIGTGEKDLWSMTRPKDDAQFAHYALDPLLPRALNAAYGGALKVPSPPRNDLLPLMQYMPPISFNAENPGPVADLLRLNTAIPPTPAAARSRLGLLAGDSAGYPNGRRVSDDITDISLRVIAGVLVPGFNIFPNNALGDGVNSNDVPYQETFPYVAWAHSGLEIPSGGTGNAAQQPPPNLGSLDCVNNPLSCTVN